MFDVQPSSTNITKSHKTFTWIVNNNGVLDAITYEELNANNKNYTKVMIRDGKTNNITSYEYNDNIKQQIYDKFNNSVKYTDYLKKQNQDYFNKLTELLGNFSCYSNNSYGWKMFNPMSSYRFLFFLPMYLDNTNNNNIIVISGTDTLTVNYETLMQLINLYAYDFKNFLSLSDKLVMDSLLRNFNNVNIKDKGCEIYQIYQGIQNLKL